MVFLSHKSNINLVGPPVTGPKVTLAVHIPQQPTINLCKAQIINQIGTLNQNLKVGPKNKIPRKSHSLEYLSENPSVFCR